MLGGMISTIVWKQVPALGEVLDIKAACVLISAALVVGVSLSTSKK